MNIAVRYVSRGGNTKKVADAIAKAVGVEAKDCSNAISGPVDVLFLGSAVYGAGVDDRVRDFIAALDAGLVKNVVNFSTAALLPSTYSQVAKLLKAKGIPLDKREFHCRGKFSVMHKGHPNDEDLKNAKDFAQSIAESCE